jgi:hypothetical protein
MLKKDLLKLLNRRIDRDKREMNGYVLKRYSTENPRPALGQWKILDALLRSFMTASLFH